MKPENTELEEEDEKYMFGGLKASSMKGKMKRPDNVVDMAVGWSKQYGLVRIIARTKDIFYCISPSNIILYIMYI